MCGAEIQGIDILTSVSPRAIQTEPHYNNLVTTTTVACQVVGSRARCHRVQMATIAERGANAGTARRARDGRRAYPANRHRVCIRTRSCVRRLTISIAIGAAFGYDTRAHALSRTLTGREASQCAVRPQAHASRPGATLSRAGVTGARPGVTSLCHQCNACWRALRPRRVLLCLSF